MFIYTDALVDTPVGVMATLLIQHGFKDKYGREKSDYIYTWLK